MGVIIITTLETVNTNHERVFVVLNKRLISVLLCFAMVFACLTMAGAEVTFKPGSYTGSTTGVHDTVAVEVTVSENKIEKIVVEEDETIGCGTVAAELMPQRIIEAQSLKVDTVSGATITSNAVLRAAEAALKQATDNLDALKKPIEKKEPVAGEAEAFDVVIVGGGIAGLNAAYELEYNYPDVSYVVLEQLDVLTGSLHGSGGAIISDKSKKHAELGQESSIEEIIKILDGGTGYPVNHSYAQKVYSIGEDILNRILDNGLPIKTSYLSAKAYSDKVYAIFADGNGEGFVQFYYDWIEKQPINLRMHSKVTALLTQDGKVTGVTVEDGEKIYDIKAKSVLLATGGFGNNMAMVKELEPDYVGYLPRVGYGADGSGFELTKQFNPQIIGNGMMGPGLAATIDCKPLGGKFMVNKDGKRVGNESKGADMAQIIAKSGETVYVIVDGKYQDSPSIFSMVEPLDEHLRKGYAKKFDSLEELADGMKINKENLLATVEAYNTAAANGTELEFGLAAASATVVDTAPYYVERVIPFYLGSIPSLKVDESMLLLNGEDQIVEGLYCAGELTEANLWDNVYPGVGVGISYATYSGPYAIRCMMEDWAK